MRLATAHAGDVVAIPGPDEPRLGELRAKQRQRLTVTAWPSPQTRERAAVTISAPEALAHSRRRARASSAGVVEPVLVLVYVGARLLHARVTARPERGEFELPLTPSISYLHARARGLQTRWTENRK